MNSSQHRPVIVLLGRLVGAVLAGLALYTSFPPTGWWWAAPLGLALLTLALAPWRGQVPRPRTGALLGFVCGLSFFLPLLPWVGLYVGAYAAWGLSVVESLYLMAFGAGAVVILRAATASRPGWRLGHSGHRYRPGWRTLAGIVALAGWWTACEWFRSSWPWGGFPWGRLAFGQADGPLLSLAGLVGATGLTFCTAALGAALGLAAFGFALSRLPAVGGAVAGIVTVLALVVLSSTSLVRAPVADRDAAPAGPDHVRVALVQGNVPRLGLDFAAQRRAVLDNHVRATLALADRIDAGVERRPDLVLWPENASDISPLANADAAALITDVSMRVGAPILVGTVLRVNAGPEATNTMLVWDGARGPVDRHDKRFIQPFGEWLPWRGLFERLFPIAKNAGHIVPGQDSGVVTIAGHRLGVATCYEIAFDAAARDPIRQGAQILSVPTNNATFGRSPMTYQQLGMSRVRAVEHHVPVLVAATSGVSAVIDPDGRVRESTGIFEQAVLIGEVPIGGAGTLATRIGGTVDLVCCLVGMCGLAWGLWAVRRPGCRPVPVEEIE